MKHSGHAPIRRIKLAGTRYNGANPTLRQQRLGRYALKLICGAGEGEGEGEGSRSEWGGTAHGAKQSSAGF